MNNFGVIEVASTRTTHAPGWAYVPDNSINTSVSSLQPTHRKRARNQPNLTLSDLSARQDAKIRKELEILSRDSHKDVNIFIPPKTGNRAQSKHTPNVRKILMSQKTFANHLDDFEALQALNENNSNANANNSSSANANTPSQPSSSTAAKKGTGKKPPPSSKAPSSLDPDAAATDSDVAMTDAPAAAGPPPAPGSITAPSAILTPCTAPPAAPPHPLDGDPLLASRIPAVPSDEELRALLSAPPLTYAEARAAWSADEPGRRYPVRVFCEVCGYWGRVKCLKCGTRVCALECLEVHREECVTRYGL